jgi:hypothetical protein
MVPSLILRRMVRVDSDLDVEPAAALEAGPAGPDAASAPVADGAWRCVDQVAELLEGSSARSSQSWRMWIGFMVPSGR